MAPNAGQEVELVQSPIDEDQPIAEKKVFSSVNPNWRPWPWNNFPDWVCALAGLCITLPPAPTMAVLIGTGEVVWAILMKLASKTTLHLRFRDAVLNISQVVANRIMRDPRNAPYLPHLVWLSFWAPFCFFLALYRHMHYGFEIWFFLFIQFIRIGPRFRFFTYNHVLLHKEGHDHRGFFKSPFNIFNGLTTWWIGPFYGGVPNSYAMSHNKIHHRYDNDLGDVHTNLDLDRTTVYSFMFYMPRFALYWNGISPLYLFIKNKEWKFAIGTAIGMLYYATIFVLFFMWSPIFALTYILYPNIEDVVFFGGISYLWHAFWDPDQPDNHFINSVTILRGKDNVWNEDFHVVHHTSPHTHWSDYPAHYEKNIEEYKKSKATIFADTEEGELLFLMLKGNHRRMAELFVDLEGKMTLDEKEDLIKKRLSSTIDGHKLKST
jgi:hypothetical protein